MLRKFIRPTAFLLAKLLLASLCFAQAPSVDRVDQSTGGKRGTKFEVSVEGLDLASINDALFFDRGVELVSLEATDDQVKLTLAAHEECRLGEHPFVLTGPQGVAEVRTIQISPFDLLAEQEPNSLRSEAQPITLPQTITGIVEETDEDWFRVALKKGDRISVEAVALPLGRYLFDALVEVFDTDGNRLAISDDTALRAQDPTISLLAPHDGEYFIRIREAAFGGDLDSRYRLHVGDFPRPSVAFPAGVPIQVETQVKLLGDAMGPIEKSIMLDGLTGETQDVAIAEGRTPGIVRVRTSDFPNVAEQEPNDSLQSATPSQHGPLCALNGILEKDGDRDYYQFEAEAGSAFEISVYAARIGSPVDSMLTLYGPDNRLLSSNDDGLIHDSLLRFVANESGTYKLCVQDHLGRGGPTHVYRVEFEPIQPKLDLRLPTTAGTMPEQMQSVVVPRGALVPLTVSCRRQNFRTPVRLTTDNLPEGVSFESEAIEAITHLGVALFRADDLAPTGAQLIQLRGEASTQEGSVYGSLSQRVGLVFGEPRKTVYHSVELDRIPLIVTESAPFTINVPQPESPLVQQGRIDLEVQIERSDDFDGEVELALALAPPWIRGPEKKVRIASEEDRGTFSLFAESQAGRAIMASDPDSFRRHIARQNPARRTADSTRSGRAMGSGNGREVGRQTGEPNRRSLRT